MGLFNSARETCLITILGIIVFTLILTSKDIGAASLCDNDVIVFELDEENPFTNIRSSEVFSSEAIRTVRNPSLDEEAILAFNIKPEFILHGGNRTEITVNDYKPEYCSISYRFSLLVPENYRAETDWQIFAQWHDMPDKTKGHSWENHAANPPPLALEYDNGYVHIVHRTSPKNKRVSRPLALDLGVWNVFDFSIVWSQNDNGKIEAKLNGKPFLSEKGQAVLKGPNIYNSMGNYFKFGIYRGPDGVQNNIVYFKDVLIIAKE